MSTAAQKLLGPPITRDYTPSAYLGYFFLSRHRPIFTLATIAQMLTDQWILFGLWLIKGPILTRSKFIITCDNEEVRQFVIDNIEQFWKTSATRALSAIEWGYSGSEVIYKEEDGKIYFDTIRTISALDFKILTKNGNVAGIAIRNSRIGNPTIYGMKCFVHTHQREYHPWYGRSRLFGSYPSWWEIWTDGGSRDSRRLFFHKCAFDGGTIYYPPGNVRSDDGLTITSNKDLARDLLEKKKNGGVLALPNTPGDVPGTKAWEYESAQVNVVPVGILEYNSTLKEEVLEGMGIPPEIAKAEGTGAYAGRRIPLESFLSTLQDVVYWVISDFNTQLLNKLVKLQYGDVSYKIHPEPLMTKEESAEETPPTETFGTKPQQQDFSQP